MLNRLLNLSNKRSFILFGARGTGKTFLLNEHFPKKHTAFIDLLSPNYFRLSPAEFEAFLASLSSNIEWVVVDEVQKSPDVLDVIHRSLNRSKLKFALTGSSARKLKRGHANLLAGRANVFHLFPLTHLELPTSYAITDILQWGTLPQVVMEEDSQERKRILRAYATTYLREEIAEEQIVRSLDPFQSFLSVAAQMNGKILNYAKIARDIGVSTVTAQSFFTVLEDTLLGIPLPPFHESIRKRQSTNVKFYLFDLGITRALASTLRASLSSSTYVFGNAFEHFVFLELYRLQAYHELDWKFSYLRTKDNAEIDFIIDRPDAARALIEVKSAERVEERDATSLNRFLKDFKKAEAIILSNDPIPKTFGKVQCLHWEKGIARLLGND